MRVAAILAGQYTPSMGEQILILRGSEIGPAHLPGDADVQKCLQELGASKETLNFRLASEFKAPGMFEQYHQAAGTASAGAIKVEEDERGVGAGSCFYVFCKEKGLEVYLAHFFGAGGELALLVRSDSKSAEACRSLSAAMGGVWPSTETVPVGLEDRVALHRQRVSALRGHVQEWFKGA